MGQLYTTVRLRNAREVVLAQLGQRPASMVSTYEAERALIDTGALHVILPKQVASQLSLLRMDSTIVRVANGTLVEVPVTEGVYVEILGRQTLVQALIMGTTVLIGAIVLEGLDLAVDCRRGVVLPNLGTIDQPVFRV